MTLSNTIIIQLSTELFSLHLWLDDDDSSFVLENENKQIQFNNLNELCMELVTNNSFHLLKEICNSTQLKQVHFEVN